MDIFCRAHLVVQEARKANDIMKNINKHINKYDTDSEYLGELRSSAWL